MWCLPLRLRQLLHGKQLESERFDLDEDPVERCLVRKTAAEDRVRSLPFGTEAWEGMQERPAKDPAHADFVEGDGEVLDHAQVLLAHEWERITQIG